jgi:hypothetical protein
MRTLLLPLAFIMAIGSAAPQAAPAAPGSTGVSIVALSTSLDQDQSVPKDVNVDINVNRGGGRWYASPVWIAIGAIAAVVVLLLIVLIARGGGGTTIVRE